MRILIAPDKFKGSLTAAAVAESIAQGWNEAWPGSETVLAPIADGGEGFAEALCRALGGVWVTTEALDPIGRPVSARYAWVESQKLAIIEMSEASGLWRLKREELAPLRANTFGTGQLIRHAAEAGAQKILVGLGGSATTDGGIGMAEALGYVFYTSDGDRIEPHPSNLLALMRIGTRGAIPLPEIIAASDVQNPLLSSRGAARVFSPQKGADPQTVETLEGGLQNLADVCTLDFEGDFRDAPGAGAAGGIGFGLMTFCRASIRSGFDLVAEVLRLEDRIAECDLVLTGEGRLDEQTLEGKGPAGVAALARRMNKPVIAFAGSISEDPRVGEVFDATCPIVDRPASLAEAMEHGADFLRRAAARTARIFRAGQEERLPRRD